MAGIRRFLDSLARRRSRVFYDVSVGPSSDVEPVLTGLNGILRQREPADLLQTVEAFEREFAARFGGRAARGVNSGTSALFFALEAVGSGPGREVVTVANTFLTTVSSIVETGATPRFCDVEPNSGMMDPAKLVGLLNERTAAIVPVHMYGGMANMREISRIAEAAAIPIVEDACQAIGAMQDGVYAGAWGTAGCFSFHATKLVGAQADGGMVMTRSEQVHAHICRMAEPDWARVLSGVQARVPSRLPALCIPVLKQRLARLEADIARREEQWRRYREALKALRGVRLLEPCPGVRSSWRNLVVTVPNADSVQRALRERGLPARRIYPRSGELVDAAEAAGDSIPETRRLVATHLALPLGEHLADADLDVVVGVLRRTLSASGELAHLGGQA